MKNFLNYLTFALFASLIIFASCGGDEEPEDSDEDIAARALTSATATIVSVTPPSGAETLDWITESFTITFTGDANGGSYSTTNVPDGAEGVWPSSGTWTFTDGSDGKSITRVEDGTEIIITVSETDLRMNFPFSDASARVKDVNGDWVFNMSF